PPDHHGQGCGLPLRDRRGELTGAAARAAGHHHHRAAGRAHARHPAGLLLAQLQRQTLSNQANMILDRVRVDTETRLQEGGEIDEALLQRRVDEQSDLNIAISVTYDGVTYSAGDPPGEEPVQKNTNGAFGQSVSVYIPESDVRAHTA